MTRPGLLRKCVLGGGGLAWKPGGWAPLSWVIPKLVWSWICHPHDLACKVVSGSPSSGIEVGAHSQWREHPRLTVYPPAQAAQTAGVNRQSLLATRVCKPIWQTVKCCRHSRLWLLPYTNQRFENWEACVWDSIPISSLKPFLLIPAPFGMLLVLPVGACEN